MKFPPFRIAARQLPNLRADFLLALPLLALIRLYQRTLSRLLPPSCRFTPSCSHYAAEALHTHRLPRALLLTTGRLLRCQPLCRGGSDPVPPGPWRGAQRLHRPSSGDQPTSTALQFPSP